MTVSLAAVDKAGTRDNNIEPMPSTELVKPAKITSLASYSELRRRIREVFERGRRRAELAVKWELTRTKWEAGKLIIKHVLLNKDRADYGKRTIRRVANDFKKSSTEVNYWVELARANPIVQPAGQLSLTHHTALLSLNDKNLRNKLTKKAIRKKWTREVLRSEIKKVRAAAPPSENGKKPSAKLLVPKRGKVGIFKIVKDGEGLAVDFGFTSYVALEGTQASKLKAGDIVQSRCKIQTNRSSSISNPATCILYPASGVTSKDLFAYEAQIDKVIDADTFWFKIWINRPQFLKEKLRLRGVDAPERGTPEGQRAKRAVERLFKKTVSITLTTTKPDKWDRYLSDIFLKMSDGGEIFLNNYLLKHSLARRYDAVHPQDWD